jgi:hypothetical protein
MTLAQASILHFDGKREMAKKRVQKLKAAGFIVEKPRGFSDPSILFLGVKGYRLLAAAGLLANYPPLSLSTWEKRARVSDLTLRHELAVMDAKAAIVTVIRKTTRYRVRQFSTWPKLNEFQAVRRDGLPVIVKPDGFMRIIEDGADGYPYEHAFFLEVDRSTESSPVLLERCHGYLHYYRSGGFARRNGGSADDFKSYPFRVLLVCKSKERVRNIARALYTGTPSIQTQVLLITLDKLIAAPLGAVWFTPKAITNGTAAEQLLGHGSD